MSEIKLDDDFYKMTREELLEDISDRIECTRELMRLHRKEELMLKQENKMLQDALIHGTSVVENASKKMSEYEILLKQGAKTILMWRNNCYLLAFILIIVAITVILK